MGTSRKIRRKKFFKKAGRMTLIVAGVALVVWIFYLGATWGPGSPDAAPRNTQPADNRELAEESLRLSREFEAIAAAGEPTEADLNLLRRALEAQRQYNQSTRPSAQERQRQEELEQRINFFAARKVFRESAAAEQESARLMAEGNATEAVRQLQLALELQRDVNQRFGRSEFRNPGREIQLQQRASSLEAQPLHSRSVELERLAATAIEERRWEDARRMLTEARDLQTRINESTRRGAFFDSARQDRLTNRIASLRVGEMASEVRALEEEALALEGQNRFDEAARAFERALTIQNRINRDHAQSEFVSTDRAAALDVSRQSALSGPQARELEAALQRLRSALVRGDFDAVRPEIETGLRAAGQMAERFPRSRYINPEARLELEYLSLLERELPQLQAALRADLRPVPGVPGWQMSAAPISQAVYSRVMSANPSRNVGPELPVDSISFPMARDFCRRASWILGRPVLLPTREQFLAALGEWSPAEAEAASWHRGNSNGATHPVASGQANAHGFLHLAGNVREWINEEAEGGRAWIAGFSFEDEPKSEELFRTIGRSERARSVGFRMVVGEAPNPVSL